MRNIEIIETKISGDAQLSIWGHAPAWLHQRWRVTRERVASSTDRLWRNLIEQERLGMPIEARRK